MGPVEDLVSEFLTGLGLGDGVRDGKTNKSNKMRLLLFILANMSVTVAAAKTPCLVRRNGHT